MRLTRGARYRLPAGEFQDGDLVIRIDPPKDDAYNINTPTDPAPSQHKDDNRFGRHRQHLLREYGHDKLKFEGHDEFMELEDGQEPIRDVYGWYEVFEWPGAKERLKDTEKFLASLTGHDHRPPSDFSPDSFDDSEQDKTFEPEDAGPLLPSEAHTIEEDIDGAVYLPSPEKVARPDSRPHSPILGAFTPVQVRQRLLKKPKSVTGKSDEAAARRKAFNENITRTYTAVPNSRSEPRRDSAIEVLAKLNAALQVDIDNGLVSPHSKRNYSKRERNTHRRSAATGVPIDPASLEPDANSGTQPRYRTQRTSYRTKKRKSQHQSVDDEEGVVTLPTKKRRSTRKSQVSIFDAGQDQNDLDPTQLRPGQKVYPPPCNPDADCSLWPQCQEAASSLPEGFQVRVRFMPNADHVLPKYRKEQSQEIDVLSNGLEKSIVYYLLTLPNWRATAMEEGLDELKSQARNYVLTKLKEMENIWIRTFEDLNVRLTLPNHDSEYGCPRLTTPLQQRTRANTGKNHIPGIASTTTASRRKQVKSLPNPVANASVDSNKHHSLTTFIAKFSALRNRQLTALLEIIRFQTSIPKALWQRESAAGTRQRRLYESNMRVAALSWQVGFFEGWGRDIGRLRFRSVQKNMEMRFWKQELVGGKAGEWEVVDLMTGLNEPLRQWQKKHRRPVDGQFKHRGIEEQHDDDEDEKEERPISRSIRKAKENPGVTTRPRRRITSHDRLQAAVGYSPPDKNLEGHNELQDELRRRKQQDQLRQNRCSQVNGLQSDLQRVNAKGPSLFAPGRIMHIYNQPLTPPKQWESAKGLGDDGRVITPQMDRYSRPGRFIQSYAQTHVQDDDQNHLQMGFGAAEGDIPLDPALQALDIQRQQQHKMQAQHFLSTPTTPSIAHTQRQDTDPGTDDSGQMPTHGEIFTTPQGTAGIRLSSSPAPSFLQEADFSGQEPLRLRGGIAEGTEMVYPSSPRVGAAVRPPSPVLAGPPSPLRFVRESGHDDEQQYEPGMEHEDDQTRVHQRNYDQTCQSIPQYLPNGAALADLRKFYERDGRTADANAVRALERGGSVAVNMHGRLVVYEDIGYGNGGIQISLGQDDLGYVDGDFGTNNLGETGETEDEAAARGDGDGYEDWKMMLVGAT